MELEQPATPDSAAVVDTVDTAPVDSNTDATTERQFDEDGLPIEAAPVDDDIEEDVDGVKFKGKKDAVERAKAERLMHKDYTQKTQTVAEEKKAAEAEKAQYRQATQLHQALAEEIGEIKVIDRQLAAYKDVNWHAWADADPAAASKAHIAFTQLQTQRGQLVGAATQKDWQLKQFAERENAKRMNEAEAVVQRELKDWSPKKYQELQDFGRGVGVEPETLRQVLINAPTMAKVINLALQHDRLQKQRATKPPAAPAPPVTRLSGTGAVSTKEPAQMSDREFAEWRKRQIAQRK
jgi:hypothetical protein